MSRTTTRRRLVVDWAAAVWAGLISGASFLIVASALGAAYLGSAWVPLRMMASVVLGASVLPPPATLTVPVLIAGASIHFALSVVMTCVIASVLHRWGLIVGILGGAVFGLAFYLINFYSLSWLFPWFYPLRSWIMLASHVVFGALAGGTYEALEEELFLSDSSTA